MADDTVPQTVKVSDQRGNILDVSPEAAQTVPGLSPLTPEQQAFEQKKEQFGSTGQQVLTAAESALAVPTFGASTALERFLGVPGEDIVARRQINPGSATLGQIGGLGASALLGGAGALGAMEQAGGEAASAAGLGGMYSDLASGNSAFQAAPGIAAKIGSSAVKGAVETALFQSGDEVSKMFAGDPDQSIGTAAANIGLSGLLGGGIGGGIGSISPLWEATGGKKLSSFLDSVRGNLGGAEGDATDAVTKGSLQDVQQTAAAAGMDVPPTVQAGLTDNSLANKALRDLEQSDTTKSGIDLQKDVKTFQNEGEKATAEALGKTQDDISTAKDYSPYEAGSEAQKTLIDELKTRAETFEKPYAEIANSVADKELPAGAISKLSEDISAMAQKQRYLIDPASDEAKVINRVTNALPNIKTLEDLTEYTKRIADQTSRDKLWDLGRNLKSIFRDHEAQNIDALLPENAPQLKATFAEARAAYSKEMNLIDNLGDRLKPGKYTGPASFRTAIGEMHPEDVIKRLAPAKDAGMLQLLDNELPNTAKAAKQHVIDTLFSKSVNGDTLKVSNVLKSVQNMTPELRSFAFSPEQTNKLGAINDLFEKYKAAGAYNFSNSGRVADGLLSKIPGAAITLAGMLTGHNPLLSLLTGNLVKILGKDIPDAARLMLLKFIGTGQPIESAAFKSAFDYTSNIIKGENLMGKTIGNMFEAGKIVLPTKMLPDDKDRDRLDKKLQGLQQDPSSLFNVGGKTSYYLPDHGVAIAKTASQAVNYLNSIRPSEQKPSPLDESIKPTAMQKQNYASALTIAEQPLSILNDVKAGTLTSQDVGHLQNMYPALYQRMQGKLMEEMVDHLSTGGTIPYSTRMGLSLFLAQPMDSTMTPTSIQALQSVPAPAKTQQPLQQHGQGPHSLKDIGKLATLDQTPGQARASARQTTQA